MIRLFKQKSFDRSHHSTPSVRHAKVLQCDLLSQKETGDRPVRLGLSTEDATIVPGCLKFIRVWSRKASARCPPVPLNIHRSSSTITRFSTLGFL